MAKIADYKKIFPDPRYQSLTLARFINYVMKKGKKQLARKIVYQAMDIIKKKTKKDPLEIFEEAIENSSPLLEVKTKRIGGANYQIPQEVSKRRRLILAMRWIIAGANSKSGVSMSRRLANEIIAASKEEGFAVGKKDESHKMAEANKAFAHYAKF
jgi:small subunit ribosomal protein S7